MIYEILEIKNTIRYYGHDGIDSAHKYLKPKNPEDTHMRSRQRSKMRTLQWQVYNLRTCVLAYLRTSYYL